MSYSNKRYIKAKRIEELAEMKYRENGLGITLMEVMDEFKVNKHQAQRKLKHAHSKKYLFTAGDPEKQGIAIKRIKRENPQRYYPSTLKSEIIEKTMKNRSLA